MAGTYNGGTILVEGLDASLKAFRKVDKNLANDLQNRLKHIAKIVATEAKIVAEEKQLHRTGKLIKGITTQVKYREAYVLEKTVSKGGYGYPSIYEFGGRARSAKRKSFAAGKAVTNRSAIGARLAASGSAQGEFGEYGPRAFMYPALEKKQHEIVREIDQMLGDLERDFTGGV